MLKVRKHKRNIYFKERFKNEFYSIDLILKKLRHLNNKWNYLYEELFDRCIGSNPIDYDLMGKPIYMNKGVVSYLQKV